MICFPRILIVEKNNFKYHQKNIDKIIKNKIYDKYKIDKNNAKNLTIKRRINNLNSDFHCNLYYGQTIEDAVKTHIRKSKHIKYRETNYKKYENKNVCWCVTDEIGDIFEWNHSDKNAERLNAIKVIKYEDCYGEIKKSALIKYDIHCKPCEIDYFYTKDEIEEKYKNEIKKMEEKLKAIKENYNNFKKQK